jgi:hypothetical protein
MIYRVCEHYYNDDLHIIKNENDELDECFVCFQTDTDNGLKPISLRYQYLYIKNCNCDGQIHKQCLELWCKQNLKCPICRIELRENIKFKNVLLTITFRTDSMYFLIRALTHAARVIKLFIFIYTSLQYIYFICLMIDFNRNIGENNLYLPYSGFDFVDNETIKNITENN